MMHVVERHVRAEFPRVVHAVWWGRHHRRCVAVMGGSGGGAGAPTVLPPPFSLSLSLHKHRWAVWSRPASLQKRSTAQPTVITHPWKHTLQPPFPFEITLPVSSFFFQRRGVQQQMRQNGRCRGGAKRGNNHGRVRCQLSAGIPLGFRWEDQFLFLSLGTSSPPRIFERLMWRPWNQTRGKTGSRSS